MAAEMYTTRICHLATIPDTSLCWYLAIFTTYIIIKVQLILQKINKINNLVF